MSKKVRIKWRTEGFREVRTRADVQAAVLAEARALAEPLGDGYVAEQGNRVKNRARASVIAATPRAMDDNRKNRTILNAVATRGRPGRKGL